MATDKLPFSLRLPADMIEELRDIARKEKRSINSMIEWFVEQGIERYYAEEEYIWCKGQNKKPY